MCFSRKKYDENSESVKGLPEGRKQQRAVICHVDCEQIFCYTIRNNYEI